MRRYAVYAAALVLATGPGTLRASVNLLSNTGFENAPGTGSPIDWRIYTYGSPGTAKLEAVKDAAAAHSGGVCVKFDTAGGYCSLMQGFGASWDPGVYPGKRSKYVFTAYARSDGEARLAVQVCVYGGDGGAPKPKTVPAKKFDGNFTFPVTAEWKEYAAVVEVPEGTTHLNIIVGGGIRSKAPLYLDDVGLYDAREGQVRFLPSKERLVVSVDTAYLRREKNIDPAAPLSADIEVVAKGTGRSAMKERLPLKAGPNVFRLSTEKLPEGEYTARVAIKDRAGVELGAEDDWFEKRIFDWMKNPRGVGEDVPAPYTALEVSGTEVRPWGRVYRFGSDGLPSAVLSQGKPWLNRPMALEGTLGGRPAAWEVAEKFSFTGTKPAEVRGRAALRSGDLNVAVESVTEYDGLIRLRVTYGPARGSVALDRLRLKAPLAGARCLFYSADGKERPWRPDGKGPGYCYDLLPAKQGTVFDSTERPQTAGLPAMFTGLFWLADNETCFCYAADTDEGWLIRDDAPSVEAVREGNDVVLWLNLVDRPSVLSKPRTLEIAFQAGPTKPLPEGWRGIQNDGDPDAAPLTFTLIPQAGSGYTLNGGTHFIHPGETPEYRQKSKERVEKALAGDVKAIGGYHYWGTVPRGFAETRVFRGEWGIDKEKWETGGDFDDWQWRNRFHGENKGLYYIQKVKAVPSYVDFISYTYDEALKCTALTGFYDDTGYPKRFHDAELGVGYVREDGVPIASSGLWIYRERWKRVNYIHHTYKRPNYTWDSQHVHAHYMPAYNFIGIWAPCEHGYYNSDKNGDNVDFYGNLQRYHAFNPARQFGQPAMVGMSAGVRIANGKVFAQDTRGMMMLAFLHDQDVGSFGDRDGRVVRRLRRARSLFRPWEKGTEFTGYWESGAWVKAGPAGVAVSLYRRPGDGVLFMVGNPGDAATATVEPDWKKLGLDPGKMTAVDAETGEPVKLTAGASRRGFTIAVGRHDVRLVAAGPAGRYAVEPVVLGAALPKPKEVIKELSDPLTGDELGKVWELGMHKGHAGAWMIDGRLCVQGHSYGYALVRRPLEVDNVSVQCMVMQGGGWETWGGSLFLYWPNGEYVQATPCGSSGKFLYTVSGAGRKEGSAISRTPVRGWSPYPANWVKVVLKPETVECWSSADGKGWVKDWEAKRGPKLAGAPQYVMLGKGSAGAEPLLQNVWAQHFSETGANKSYFSDLIVGRD